MLDPNNVVTISGGLVADPEVINDKILKLRLAVNFAGNEKDSGNTSGYFDVTYFLNSGDKNAEFVQGQLNAGNLKKGSQVRLMGRLVQERWTTDGKNNARVVIVAEALTYNGARSGSDSGESSAPAAPASVAPSNF